MKNDPFSFVPTNQQSKRHSHEDFEELEATELYCPKCNRAAPVNKYLLLILPEGDKYEYRCRLCGTKGGKKTDQSGQFYSILKG